jgi:hypothetical protein
MMLAMMLVMSISMPITMAVTGTILVAVVLMVANDKLAAITVLVLHVSVPVYRMVHPGARLIDNHFISPVKVVPTASSGQRGGKNPFSGIQVNELMLWYVIISFNIRKIIVVRPVISGGAPLRLGAYIDSNSDLRLHMNR